MNKETYEALKRIMSLLQENRDIEIKRKDMEQVEAYIDEVAKEYQDE